MHRISDDLERVKRAALQYARRGLYLVPLCHPTRDGECGCGRGHSEREVGKAPLTRKGVKDSACDQGRVQKWWEQYPGANIGLDLELSNILLIDLDSAEAVQEAEELGLDPSAPRVLTGGGGQHVYFRAPEKAAGSVVRQGQSAKIDVKCNGYSVLPPSRHRSGKHYRWRSRQDALRFLRGELPAAPEWAVQLLGKATAERKAEANPAPPADVQDIARRCLPRLPREWQERWGEMPEEDRSGWAFSIGCASVEAGVTDPTEIAALVYTSQAHRAKFRNRRDGWTDALRIARRALRATAPDEIRPAKEPRGGWRQYVRPIEEIMREPGVPPRWVVEGVVREGLTLFAAKRKTGKSWFVQQLATAVGLNREISGIRPAHGGRVLYMALEGEDPQERFLIQRGAGVRVDSANRTIELLPLEWETPKNIDYAQQWPRLDKGGLELLKEYLHAYHDTALVIIDTFQAIRGRPKYDRQTLYELDYTALQPLREIAHAYRTAIIAVHHLRKAEADDELDAINASEGLAAAADNILILRRSRRARDRATLFVTGRGVPERKLALRFRSDNCRWEVLGTAVEYPDLTAEQRQILSVLAEAGRPLTAAEIHKRLPDVKYDAVRKRLRRMVAAGILTTMDGEGFYALRGGVLIE